MKRFTLALSLLLVLTFFATASAHPGGTDEYGGHVDHSTGEYHYHHGEPAHYHTNGICPYTLSPETTKAPSRSYSSSTNTADSSSDDFPLFWGIVGFGAIWYLFRLFVRWWERLLDRLFGYRK